jgi:hypothetical protein
MMVVDIVNITDGPGKTPRQVDIYNHVLNPGESTKLPAHLVDRKVRLMEDAGYISIGQVPPWYAAAKARGGRKLTQEEISARTAPKVEPKKEAKKDEPEKLTSGTIAKETAPTKGDLLVIKHKGKRFGNDH